MVFKVSGLFNQFKNRFGFGAKEPSGPTAAQDNSTVSNPIPDLCLPLPQLPMQVLSEPSEHRIEHAEDIDTEVAPNRSQVKKSSRKLKLRMPMRQRWRRSAARAAKKAQSLQRR